MFITASLLIILGIVTALSGVKLFRVLLPLIGFVSGIMVGFGGFQGVFGKGVVSSSVAVVVALVVGTIMALLSFVFFRIALIIYIAVLGAAAMTFLGVTLGLNREGFVLFMLALSGGILAGLAATSYGFTARLIIALTALFGVALFLVGLFLVVGKVSLADLNERGVIESLLRVLHDSFLWFFVWIGGSLFAIQAQTRTLEMEFLNDQYQFVEVEKKKKR